MGIILFILTIAMTVVMAIWSADPDHPGPDWLAWVAFITIWTAAVVVWS